MKGVFFLAAIIICPIFSKGQNRTISLQEDVESYVKHLQNDIKTDSIIIYGKYCTVGIESANEYAIVVYKKGDVHFVKAFDTYSGLTDLAKKHSEGFEYYQRYKSEIDSIAKIPQVKSSAHGSYFYIKTITGNQIMEHKNYMVRSSIYDSKLWYLFMIMESETFYMYRNIRYKR